LNKMPQFNNKNKGFTLIEIIVAILIVTVGVLAAYIVTQKIVFYTYQISSRLTAACLAKEGIEIVRNIKDTNWLESASSWDEGIAATSDYRLDYQSLEFPGTNCNLSPEEYLKHDGAFYNCSSSGPETKFKRKITITHDGADKLIVSVKVTWEEKGDTYGPITVQEILYDWYPSP